MLSSFFLMPVLILLMLLRCCYAFADARCFIAVTVSITFSLLPQFSSFRLFSDCWLRFDDFRFLSDAIAAARFIDTDIIITLLILLFSSDADFLCRHTLMPPLITLICFLSIFFAFDFARFFAICLTIIALFYFISCHYRFWLAAFATRRHFRCFAFLCWFSLMIFFTVIWWFSPWLFRCFRFSLPLSPCLFLRLCCQIFFAFFFSFHASYFSPFSEMPRRWCRHYW